MPPKKAAVWKYCEKVADKKVQCLLCQAILAYNDGSTSNLRKHLSVKHKSDVPEISEEFTSSNFHYVSNYRHKSTNRPQNIIPGRTIGLEDQESEESISALSARPCPARSSRRGRKSAVWKYYRKDKDSQKVECLLCHSMRAYNGFSTSNLWKHIFVKHSSEASEMSDVSPESNSHKSMNNNKSNVTIGSIVANRSSENILELPSGTASHFALTSVSDSTTSNSMSASTSTLLPCKSEVQIKNHSSSFKTNQQVRKAYWDEKVMAMIVSDLQPISIVEKKGFIELMNAADPQYALPSVADLSTNLLPKLYEGTVDSVRKRCEGIKHFALSTDWWSSENQENFLSVTAHFISPWEWTPQSIMLATKTFHEMPTGKDLSDELQRIVSQWNMSNKITLMVTDKKTSELLSNEQLPWTYIPCLGQLIHVIVTEAISADIESVMLIDNVSNIVNLMKDNGGTMEILNATTKDGGLNSLGTEFISVVSTRWNSIFYMLENMVLHLDAVNSVLKGKGMEEKCLSSDDAEDIKKILASLKPFEAATTSLLSAESGSNNISMALPLIKGLVKMMDAVVGSREPLTEHLRKGLVKNFGKMEEIKWVVTSTLLDPRFKRFPFADKDVIINTKEFVTSEVSLLIGPEDNSSESLSETTDKTSSTQQEGSFWEYMDNMTNSVNEQAVVQSKSSSEVQCFWESPPISRNENLYLYWKQRQDIFPNMSKIALKYLTAPMTCVSPARLFTEEGETFMKQRSLLTPQNVDTILLLNKNM